MYRPSTSKDGERTPLVAPTYVFESSLSRSYQKRLRNFQCICCASLMIILAISLLVTVTYNLGDFSDDNTTELPSESNSVTLSPISVPTQVTSQATPISSATPVTSQAPPPINSAAQVTSQSPRPISNLTLRLSPGSPNVPVPVLISNQTLAPELKPLMEKKWPLAGREPPKWSGKNGTADIQAAVAFGKIALKRRKEVERKRRPLETDTPANRAQNAAATSEEVKPWADAAYAAEQATKLLVDGTTKAGSIGVGPSTNGSFPEPPYCLTAAPCPPSKYRSMDGTCNNLNNPLRWGVSRTPFRRVLPADYGDGVSSPRTGVDGEPLPSARDVSVTVHRPSYAHDTQFTVMLAVWGQFVDHDITATALSKGENSSSLSCCDPSQPPHPECFPVQLDVEDPFYQDYNLTCMEFVRSAPAPICHFGPREQMNQATAFIDGSTVYGYGVNRAAQLRSGTGGRLKMLRVGARELLPPSTDPNDGCNTAEMNAQGRYCFETGDDRANENLHLTTMHLIWARQHNRLATALAQLNPAWDDDTVYFETRKILGAQMQHITYTEFLPAILGNDVMWALNLTVKAEGYATVYDPSVDPTVANHFSAAVFRFAHTLLPGLIHSVDASTGTVNYVQLHQMLFNPYALYKSKGPKNAVSSALNTPVHGVGPHVTTELNNHLFERTVTVDNSTAAAKKPGPCGLDLVSLNIQRGRDHGLPPYPLWREHCGLSRPKNFTDLGAIFDESSLSRICKIYKSVDDIDLYTGALAEDPRGRLLGPTLSCLIADQFLRLKVGDRFWYETNDTTVGFTAEQLTEIRKTTLAGVICINEVLLDKAQPRVMEAVSPTNPLVDCMELPQPSLKPWKQPDAQVKPTKKKKT
ncbi:chorion peroxidase-like isoform X2 [Plodia interpunctella]|uniref:chorion peroxidase-like isoform X2 n=1 Tax=Plodia interpunctella TaxID=58824 RepID=UPI00236764AB|nr:chorion peroxidase-like isoform X2 [Plodia interpunctella]